MTGAYDHAQPFVELGSSAFYTQAGLELPNLA
jgi:hypothetical protein